MRFFERESAIVDAATGKSVLHLGCIGFADSNPDERVELFRKSLHYRLSALADVTGIDYAEPVITKLQADGHGQNIVCGNVELLDEVDLHGTYDVVLAGDIIEHIDNPGRMLSGIRRFFGPETELILTTPNAFGLPGAIRYAVGRFEEAREHVLSFNPYNLEQLLQRYGFEIVELHTCYQHWADAEHSAFSLAVAKRLFRAVPRWGGTLFVRARLAE
ncbi:MAG: methyltransferase domain-containing protein [Rhodothermales bacterium]|nr:methyltransferase domain-containing protein [Rhodothermales bacterium]